IGKAVHSSQSLQDLMSATCFHADSDSKAGIMRSVGVRANKLVQSRHNSITSSSQLPFLNNNNINLDNCSDVSSVDTRTSSQLQTQNSLKGVRNKGLKGNSTQHSTATSSPISGTGSACGKTGAASGSCSVRSDDESGVCEPTTNSSHTFHECFATQSVVNHNMETSCDKYCTPLCNRAPVLPCAPAVDPQQPQYIEMRDLRQKAHIVEYTSSDSKNSSVDSFMNLNLKAVNSKDGIKTGVAERVVNNSCDYEPKDGMASEDNKLNPYAGLDAVKPYEPSNHSLINNQDSGQIFWLLDLSQANHNNNNQNYSSLTGKDQTNRYVALPAPSVRPHITPNDTHSLSQICNDLLRNANNFKKKKAKDVPTKLAQDIEGYIGFIEDVNYLEALINSSGIPPTNPESLKAGAEANANSNAKKKEKSIQMMTNSVSKRKNGSNGTPNQSAAQHKSSVSPNIPLSTSSSSFSSDEANSVSKHSDFAQRTDSLTRETTSPLNSSTESKDKTPLNGDDLEDDNLEEEKLSMSALNSSFSLIGSNVSADLLYTASDSEAADREKGFITPKSKHFKRRKGVMRRLDNQMNNKSRSMQSSTSTTPPSSTISGAGMRGYESEREYMCSDDYRRRQNSSVCSRRKSLSSVPHSEHNSAYNSDGELSSHSMPVRNDSLNTEKSTSDSRTTPSSISSTPKASYADIAKTPNFGISSMGGLSAHKRSSMDANYMTNAMINPLSVQYQDFPQLDVSLPPVVDVSTPTSSPNSNSKIIEALVSPPQKSLSERRTSDSCSAPTSMTNTPVPHTDAPIECLFSETLRNSNTDVTTIQPTDDAVVPAVIMCDYSESVPTSDIGSVTFGFFDDDLSANSGSQDSNQTQTQILNETQKTPEFKAKSPIKTSPEAISHANSRKIVEVSGEVELTYIDVDKKSFNYEHIIGFIKKAWDNAKRDYQYQSYESSPAVK
ncbi:unnamed protein product, partial [Oppiella nova]